MRDPNRTARILDLIGQLWRKYPQLRLGQLLVNVAPRFGDNAFFVEDDVLEERLKHVLDNGFGSR